MKTKSIAQITAQRKRIQEYDFGRALKWKVTEISLRYIHNICNHLDYHPMWTFQEDERRTQPVPASIYAKQQPLKLKRYVCNMFDNRLSGQDLRGLDFGTL